MRSLILLSMALIANNLMAQNLPKMSPKSTITQEVGMSEVKIEYSRPSVKDRVIFGDLVQYGEVWRFGANGATKIYNSHPVNIDGQKLDTGWHSIFAKPGKTSWEIIFNKNADQWGAYDYDEKLNEVVIKRSVKECVHAESFTIEIKEVTTSEAWIVCRWATTEIDFPISFDTESYVNAEISRAINEEEDKAKVYYNAAQYYFDTNNDKQGEALLSKSLTMKRAYYNVFLLSEITAKSSVEDAKEIANEAIKLAKKAEKQNWADYIEETMNGWESKE